MDILKTLENQGLLDNLANQFGLDKAQVGSIIEKGLPSITNQISHNTADQGGLDSFAQALTDHRDRDLGGMLKNTNNISSLEGGKILDHIFGRNKDKVEEEISREVSNDQPVSKDKIDGILKIIAPIVMVMIAKRAFGKKAKGPQTQTQAPTSKTDDRITLDLGREREKLDNNTKSGIPGILNSMLDKNKNGSFLDDLLGNIF